MKDLVIRAFKVSTPIVGIATPDPQMAAKSLAGLPYQDEASITISWDSARGVRLITEGQAAQTTFAKLFEHPELFADPLMFLTGILALPKRSVVLAHNLQRFWENPVICQGISNVRDEFKKQGKMLVMLGAGFRPPTELVNDIYIIDEELPTAEEIKKIIDLCYKTIRASAVKKGAEPPPPITKPEIVERIVDACRGLSAFAVEQIFMMSVTSEGVDLDLLWNRKVRHIEHTQGLKVHRGKETYQDLGGLDNLKKLGTGLANAKRRPKAIVFLDEVDKSGVAATGDTSGTNLDELGVLLTFMEDTRSIGLILFGPPGTAKSHFAKATGNECGVPTIILDMGATKSKWVGESEDRIRQAMKVVRAIAGGELLFIATCNRITDLPMEFRRRFTFGIYYLDLPTAIERKVIWPIHMKNYGLSEQKLPDDDRWTGAEIRNCCDTADRLGIPIEDAAKFIMPVAVSAASRIEQMRKECTGKFLSASYEGPYKGPEEEQVMSDGGIGRVTA